jgi:hypothetical protein
MQPHPLANIEIGNIMTEIIVRLGGITGLEISNKNNEINITKVNVIGNEHILTCSQTDFIDFCHACIRAYDE